MKNFLFVLLLLNNVQMAHACPVGRNGLSKKELTKLKKSSKKLKDTNQDRKISSTTNQIELPSALGPEPWGGKDSQKWRPEAILANAASYWLNNSWNQANVSEVIVSVPVKMIYTNERVYGDGQTNSSLRFGDNWNYDRPQLVATLIKYQNGVRHIVFSFSSNVKLSTPKIQITSFIADNAGKTSRKDETLEMVNRNGLNIFDWNVPSQVGFGDLNINRVVWVHPVGWDSSFPIDFRMPIYTTQKLSAFAVGAKTAGSAPLDPMNIYNRSKHNADSPQSILLNSSFGPEWIKNNNGTNELRNESIHGEIHRNGNEVKTAVGGGLTWLVDKGVNSTFKNLYTCFDPRNYQKESQYGVPSGGGWHEIGDAAETIINDLEKGPAVVGFATGLPWPTPPDNNKFAWGLSDVASVRFLMPGEGLTTPAGDQTWKEDHENSRGSEPSGGGRNYHWFMFPGDAPTCTQEWVHSCRPTESNGLGLNCK
ncbi:MAG: hypothetical protein ACXVLQ_04855 [Bacteriovorax sp.]